MHLYFVLILCIYFVSRLYQENVSGIELGGGRSHTWEGANWQLLLILNATQILHYYISIKQELRRMFQYPTVTVYCDLLTYRFLNCVVVQ